MIRILVKLPHTLESRRALGETVLVSEDTVQRSEVSCLYRIHLLIPDCLPHWTSSHISLSRESPLQKRL